jgi:hypothetical protein
MGPCRTDRIGEGMHKKSALLIKTITIALVMLALAKYFKNWPMMWDLPMWDETFYMGNGIYNWDSRSFRHHENSPLYSYIYRMAGVFMDDPVRLIQVVGLTGSLGALFAVFAGSYAISRNMLLAASGVALLVVCDFGMVMPRLIFPAIIFLIVGAAAAYQFSLLATRLALLALAALLAAFIRPEFALAFHIYFLLALGVLGHAICSRARRSQFSERRAQWLIFAGVMVLILLITSMWTFPTIKGGERALMAFGQHYSLYWATITGATMDPFLNWKAIMADQLPSARSEMHALMTYPAKVMGFLIFNVIGFFWKICDSIHVGWIKQPVVMVAIALSVAMLLLVAGHTLVSRKGERVVLKSLLADLATWFPLALPVLVSILLIYAREHYIAVLASLAVIGSAVVARHVVKSTPMQNAAALVLGLVLVVFLQPAPVEEKGNMQVVQGLRAQGNMGRLLELDGGWCYYMPSSCTSRFMLDIPGNVPYMEYIAKENITAIVLSKSLIGFATANQRSDFLALANDPDRFEWKKIHLNDDHSLLVKLNAEPELGGMFADNLISFISDMRLGKRSGAIENKGDTTIWIRPGSKVPTTFKLDVGRISEEFRCSRLRLIASMPRADSVMDANRSELGISLTITSESAQPLTARVDLQNQVDVEVRPTPNEKAQIEVYGSGSRLDGRGLLIKISPLSCR